MIHSFKTLDRTVDQLGLMYRALASLREEVLPQSPEQFALLAEGPLDEIRQLLEEINAYAGVHEAQTCAADVWIRLEGPRLSWPDIPVSILAAFLDAFRKGVRAAADLLTEARSESSSRQLCDFRVTALEPGSLRVGLRLPDEEVPEDGDPLLVKKALKDYMEVAAWVGSNASPADLWKKVGDGRKARVLLDSVRKLAPSSRGEVTDIELTGRLIGEGPAVRLTQASKKRIRAALESVSQRREETREGVIREIDLDRRTFILRGGEKEIFCRFAQELADLAKQGFDRRVRVRGELRQQAGRDGRLRLEIRELSILENGAPVISAAGEAGSDRLKP